MIRGARAWRHLPACNSYHTSPRKSYRSTRAPVLRRRLRIYRQKGTMQACSLGSDFDGLLFLVWLVSSCRIGGLLFRRCFSNCSKLSRSVRERYAYERHWIPLLRIKTVIYSDLVGLGHLTVIDETHKVD